MYTAASLELYSMQGADNAAAEIGVAIEAAKFEIKDKIGNGQHPSVIIRQAYEKFIDPVLEKFKDFGANDTEPRNHAVQALINTVKDALGIDQNEYHPEFSPY
jgi:hypothetical protein